MLRFIRKYQLFILVIGGSLLMVVFLLEPVLTRLAPSPLKTKVAKLENGSTYTRADIQRANLAISLLKRVNPRALSARDTGGLGLDQSDEANTALHWLLLVEQAEAAGLVGESGDGAAWIAEISQTEAFIQVRTEVMQGITQAQEAETRINELTQQIVRILERNASLSAANAGGQLEDVYKILAQARGIYRMYSAELTLPAFSDLNSTLAAHDQYDSIAIDGVVLDSSLLVDSVSEPTDEQLQAFFETYKADLPENNEFGIGYTQPTRIQIGWLTLDTQVFANAVEIDRIELNKYWQQNRDTYPGDFALEKIELERQFRTDEAVKMMSKADQIIRAQVVTETKGLTKTNGTLVLPEDWESRRPKLEDMADQIVSRVNDQFQVNLPRPSITMIGDRWLNRNGISALPGIGQSVFRVGSKQLQMYNLTQFFELTEPNTTGIDVQVGLPLVDPAAQDENGNRYYPIVLGVREAGPADSIEDVTRQRVMDDYKSVEAFKMLQANIDAFELAIRESNDLAPAVTMAMDMSIDSTLITRPSVLKNLLVREQTIERGQTAARVDNRMNTESFRAAVLEAGEDLNPLLDPNQEWEQGIAIVQAAPESRSVLISRVIAPRPMTSERFQTLARTIIASASRTEISDASTDQVSPFSFDALSARYGLTKLDKESDPNSES